MEFNNKTEEIAALFDKARMIQEEKERIEANGVKEEPEAVDDDVIVEVEADEPKEVGNFIGLNGIMMKEEGVLTKTKYFNMIKVDESKYDDITFTEEEAKRISTSMRHMTTGINAAVPMNCKGQQCPFASTCPYVREDKIPLGRPCLVESQLIDYWTQQYIEEFDVDMANLTEVYMISELAEYNIYEKRVTEHLAETHQNLMQEVVTSVDHTGEEIINEEISRAWELKERIKKNRMKVLEALMATRKERTKLKVNTSTGTSAAEQMSDLKKKLDEIKATVGKMQPIETSVIHDAQEES